MYLLETVLSPIVWLMEWLLDFYVLLFSSTGVSILLLSFTFALLLLPLQRIAQRMERRVSDKMKSKGKQDFRCMEKDQRVQIFVLP